jgi:parallel beta-helix repeat protein
MRKWAVFVLALFTMLVAMGCSPTVTSADTSPGPALFPDVPSANPYSSAVEALVQAHVITGFENGVFGPAAMVSRQQFAKMVVLAMRIPVAETDVSAFTDVERAPAGSLYPDHYIAVCAANRITEGTGPGKFSPDREITWAQVLTMIVRATDRLRPGALKTPPLIYVSTWGTFDPTHGATAAKAEYNGLLEKLPVRSKSPWETISRGEVAQVLANLVVANVKDLGALGDGTADDTTAIQAAIDKASGMGGGIVFFPAGTYKTTAELRIASGRMVLAGEGADSILSFTSPARPEVGITIQGESILDDVEIRDLSLVGNYAKWAQVGIGINSLRNARFENLTIKDVGFCGIFAFNATDVTVNDISVTHCGDFGVQFKEGSTNVTVSNCRLDQFQSRQYPGHGIYFEGVENAIAFGNHITNLPSGNGNEISGIKYSGSSGHCFDNVIEDAFGGISTPGGHDVVIEGNTIRRTIERGIYILAGASNITVKSNTLENAGRGIQFNAYETWPTNVRIIDNTVLSGGTVDLYGGPASMIVEMTGNSWQQGTATP